MRRILVSFGFIALLLDSGLVAARGAPAEGLPALAGRVILAGCRQGECGWIRVVSVESVTGGAEGELRRLIVRRGSSVHLDGNLPSEEGEARIEWEANDGVDYAFCSVRRPAYGFERDGDELVVHFLDLFDLAGYQHVSAGLYMRLCHGRERRPRSAVLRRLGYRRGTRSEQVEDATVETMTRF